MPNLAFFAAPLLAYKSDEQFTRLSNSWISIPGAAALLGVSKRSMYRFAENAVNNRNFAVIGKMIDLRPPKARINEDGAVRPPRRPVLVLSRDAVAAWAPGIPGNPTWSDSNTQRANARKRWEKQKKYNRK